jgi:hypothetical protein
MHLLCTNPNVELEIRARVEGTQIENRIRNGFLVFSIELPRRIEWAAYQLGVNDKLNHG